MGGTYVQDVYLGCIWPTGGGLAILNVRVLCSWFYFPPHPTQALAVQGEPNVMVLAREVSFTSTVEPGV